MWRNQSYSTSRDSMLDLGKEATTAGGSNTNSTFSNDNSIADKIRGKSACRNGVSWKPPYVGRCLGECDISQSKYNYPLTVVRPDYVTMNCATPNYMLPSAPDLPYSKHTPPHWMSLDDPRKYFKAGYTGNRFFTYPQFGHTSKVDTHSALCDFTNGYQFTKSAEWAQLPFYHAALDGERPGNEIYPMSSAIIPSYKGHVPGMQQSYGKTFGHESVNAKRHLNEYMH